jgi:hypothetical protein
MLLLWVKKSIAHKFMSEFWGTGSLQASATQQGIRHITRKEVSGNNRGQELAANGESSDCR